MTRPKFKTLILMPYLPLEGYIKFDNLILWSFKKYKDTFIKDQALKEHIDKLVACYKRLGGSVIQSPTIVSVGKKANFSNPTRKSIAKIEALKNILLFAGVMEINSMSFVTSDNFEVFYQRFNVGEEGIATDAGAIHRVLTGGYKIDEITFLKPEYTNIPFKLGLNVSVLKALEDCLINSAGNSAKSQVVQSLNPFFNAYRNSHEQSLASRILLMIMTFELLFGETERQNFRKNIQKYSQYGSGYQQPTYKYPIIHTETGKIISEEQLTLNQIWAEEFYKLRHKIIHGNTIYSEDFIFKNLLKTKQKKEPHFYIAINFYVVCLLNRLREIGFQNAPHLVINPEANKNYWGKNISGIKNETFKIEDRDLHDSLVKVFQPKKLLHN